MTRQRKVIARNKTPSPVIAKESPLLAFARKQRGRLWQSQMTGSGQAAQSNLLYGISKFPLTLYPLPEGRGRGEGANLLHEK